MTTLPKISFVIPLFNHLAETEKMLTSLLTSLPVGLRHEIILVDDGSTDGTREWLQAIQDARIRVHLNERNLGYAATNNVGVGMASGELLGLLNNDLLFEPGWLEPMLAVLQAPQLNAGVVGNVQTRVADGKLDHAGVQLNPNAKFGHIQTLDENVPPYTKVLAVTGACLLLYKADFDAQSGFDERFVNGCEDIDLCFKLHAAGKAVYVANTSRIRHHVSLSRDVNTLQNERNSRHLFSRWRKVIKQELATLWATLLQAGPQAYPELLSGQLCPEFVARPHTAARVIAEAMLLREEIHWARGLGEPNPNLDVAKRCTAQGLSYMPNMNGYAMTPNTEFSFSGLCSARNFYLCGLTTVEQAKQPIVITITVNGIQTQTVTLTTGRNVNVGIVDPILLQGLTNYFRVESHFVDEQGQSLGDASAAIFITYIIIDDQIVGDL